MFEITVGYHGARKKGREKVEGKKKEEKEGGNGGQRDERIACPASIRFATKGPVSCLRGGVRATRRKCVLYTQRGDIKLYRTFHFSRSRPPLSTVLSADPLVNPEISRGEESQTAGHPSRRVIIAIN